MFCFSFLTFALLSASRLAFSAPEWGGSNADFEEHRHSGHCDHRGIGHGGPFLPGPQRPHNHGFGKDFSHSHGMFGHQHPPGHAFGHGGPISHVLGQDHSPIVFKEGPPGLDNFPGTSRPSLGADYHSSGSDAHENQHPGSSFVEHPRPHNHGVSTFDKEKPFEDPYPHGGAHNSPNVQGDRRPTSQISGNSESLVPEVTGRPKPSGERPKKRRPGNEGSNQQSRPKRRLLPDGDCGAEITDKIIGGDDAKLDEFPWMALLRFSTKEGQDRGFGCGGSLINERYVVTAAHCIKGASLPSNVVVRSVTLGEYDVTKERDCINGVCSPTPIDAAVEEIIVHPDYRPSDRAQQHDIALIRLRRKVSFNAYVSPICLPFETSRRKDYTGEHMMVAGWGKTSNGANGTSSSVKQKVSLPYVSLNDCQTFYESINIRLKNTQMCAGGEKAKDSCQGDSGGPLMSNEVANGQVAWFLAGVVSFGPENCGVQNVAGVYTKVSEYVDWILDNIRE